MMKYLLACSCKLRNIFFDGCQPTAQQHRHLSRTQPRMKAPLPPLSTASILSRCCFLFVWVMQQRISANLLCRYMFGEHIAILFFFFFFFSTVCTGIPVLTFYICNDGCSMCMGLRQVRRLGEEGFDSVG